MSVVLGIDVGGSTTKIVAHENKIIGMLQVRAGDQLTSLYGAIGHFLQTYHLNLADVERIVLTGVGASLINENIYGIPTQKIAEFEAIGKKRGSEASNTDRIVTELLTQMDGFEKNPGRLIVIAATNLPWLIDSALTRPKRLTHHIYVPLPDAEARRYLLTRRFAGLPCSGELDFDHMVRATEGFNGADLDNLVDQACAPAIQRGSSTNDYNQFITQFDVNYALAHVKSSVRPDDVRRMNEFLSSLESR